MNAKEFIESYKTKYTKYCPCIITQDGDVMECASGHTEALIELHSREHTWEMIPKGVMPMQYLIVKTGAVVVDYENQVYSESLSDEQKAVLTTLADEGMIEMHLGDIHGRY